MMSCFKEDNKHEDYDLEGELLRSGGLAVLRFSLGAYAFSLLAFT